MSNRSKGRATELEYKKILEKKGELVYLVKMPTKFSLNQDMWNLFDGMSLDPITKQKTFFQCKTNNKPKLQPFIDFKKEYLKQEDKVIVAIKYNYKGWKEVSI